MVLCSTADKQQLVECAFAISPLYDDLHVCYDFRSVCKMHYLQRKLHGPLVHMSSETSRRGHAHSPWQTNLEVDRKPPEQVPPHLLMFDWHISLCLIA